MQPETTSLTDREQQLQKVVLEYLEAVDSGRAPTPTEVVTHYPELAAELTAFFADQEGLVPMLGPLRRLAAPEPVPSRLGDYEILGELGRGGMGVVYKARQLSLNRLVAVKLLRDRALATPADRDRFRQEAESAAHLDHPHIAPIYEVGEHQGQLYFSMKLLDGGSLSQGVGGQRSAVSPKDAAQLVATVARAVHHAHQRGILHRDLKPSNILLDNQGIPYVTDFGLAKRLEGDGRLTLSGVIVGTPEYLAPEQAQAAKRLTTAADVYGLGVVLYEVLTGRVPFRGDNAWQTLRHVVEQEPPPVRKSAPQVDRDLETVCLKCLAKDPARRYGSTEALAEDLERWLAGVPVTARPAGRLERAWRWCRRKPAQAGLVAALLLLAVVMVVAPMVSLVLLRAENARGDEVAAVAKAVNDFWLNDVLGQADIANQPVNLERNKDITVRELLNRAAQGIEAQFQGKERTEAAIRHAIGMAYLALGEYPEAQEHLERSLALCTDKLGPNHLETLRTMNDLSILYASRGWYGEAESLYRQVLEERRAQLGFDHPDTLRTMNNLAVLYRHRSRYGEAEPLHNQVLDARRARLGPDHPDTLRSMNNLVTLYLACRRYDEAEPLIGPLLDAQRARLGPDHPETLRTMNHRAGLYRNRGRYDEAEALYKQVLEVRRVKRGPDHPDTLQTMNNLAVLYRHRGRYGEAESLYRQVLEVLRVKLDPDHPTTLEAIENLAVLYAHWRRHDEAEPLFKQVLAARRDKLGPDHPDTLLGMAHLAALYRSRDRFAEAEPLLLEAVGGARKRLGLSHPHTQQYIENLAAVYDKTGRSHLAEPLRRELAELMKKR